MPDQCCQLHVHDSRSFMDGLNSTESLVARAAELGQPGIGLANHGHLYSAPAFFLACQKEGIKGIIGMEAYETLPHTWDPDPMGPHHALFKGKWESGKHRYFHITLWCINATGWRNLCAIHTQSFTQGFKPKNQPLVDRATLERHNEGIIVGLGCPQSRTNRALERGFDEAVEAAKWYFEVFEDRAVVEVMSALPEQVRMLSDQRKLAKHFGSKVVGTNDVHYVWQEDGKLKAAHHMLVMARKFKSTETAAADTNDQSEESFGSWYGSDQFYMKTRDEMIQAGIFASEVDTSVEILNRADFDFLGQIAPKPPTAHVPAPGIDPEFDLYVASYG